jgi:hypothetical protein
MHMVLILYSCAGRMAVSPPISRVPGVTLGGSASRSPMLGWVALLQEFLNLQAPGAKVAARVCPGARTANPGAP